MPRHKIILTLLFIFSVFFFVQDLGHHGIEYRDDEIFYFNSTKEMVEKGKYLSPTYFGENRFQKPILFYWLIVLSYKVFGVSWFAARFIAVLFAAGAVCLTWTFARRYFDEKTATVSCMILATVPLFFRHAKNAVPDMALNFFIVLAIYFAWQFFQDPARKRYSVLFFVACGLGFMIKGFAAIVIPFLTVIVYALWTRRAKLLANFNFPLGLVILAILILPWFFYMISLHGEGYTEYMLKTETLNRMVALEGNPLSRFGRTFLNNSVFYLRTLLSYFAPWSVFAFAAVPWGVWAARHRPEQREAFLFLSIWFFVVFLFFSSIFARINHLVLVLSTPFAILTARFLLETFTPGTFSALAAAVFRKGLASLIILLGCVGLVVLRVFLIGSSKLWVPVALLILIGTLAVVLRSRGPFSVALVLGSFLVFVYFQTEMVSQAGLTAHSTLQRMAAVINGEADDDDIIAVGSDDIHEKEFQVYFAQRVEKVATSEDAETRQKLAELFQFSDEVYCLVTEEDYRRFLQDFRADIRIVREDFIARRRMQLDGGILKALLHLDRGLIRGYLMEKVILLKKG